MQWPLHGRMQDAQHTDLTVDYVVDHDIVGMHNQFAGAGNTSRSTETWMIKQTRSPSPE